MATREVTDSELLAAKLASLDYVLKPDRWWLHQRAFADGRVLHLLPLIQGNRLGVSKDADGDVFVDVYDYADIDASWRAAIGWDGAGDPEGWVRHRRWGDSDARRRPDGTPESEYRAP